MSSEDRTAIALVLGLVHVVGLAALVILYAAGVIA